MNDRKARRASGRELIEVVSWRKSSRSGSGANGANCVEAGAWRKSSRSSGGANGANCVEAASCTCHGIAVRDSKHFATPPLAITRADWAALLTAVRADAPL